MLMQKFCYVLGALGILLAIYWLATSEALGVPLILVGIVHIGLAARSAHVAMQVGCTGLAIVSLVAGLVMLSAVKSSNM